jgi:hypothetical protein
MEQWLVNEHKEGSRKKRSSDYALRNRGLATMKEIILDKEWWFTEESLLIKEHETVLIANKIVVN